MKIFNQSGGLRTGNRLLYFSGWVNVALVVLFILLSWIDDRAVTGQNTWMKPLKFSASFVVFLWTFAWILSLLPDPRKARWISIGLFICMVMELGTISLQAARGVPSHYNISTLFDAVVFQIMGLFILANTLIVIYIAVLFCRRIPSIPLYRQVAIGGGLVIFVLGAVSGGMMVALGAHSIGVVDGGDGLPIVNWSTAAGDLRAAHFFTLHALQIVPLMVFLFASGTRKSVFVAYLITLGYAGFCAWLHVQALSGLPLVAM